ncbi:M23 family metallopeptidase [Thermocrinis minervae]|uniref:Murein DD-endopeptidase MepM and murein hydrolase activator NlpD, contain LysM domain n=1 Tax=Thermocrinis minervae TaxID=381751 RepID=A0A1M6SJ06_9AQUI|nr:M23 family metallopeptidase [Thermocrinis minervae]SHK44731.1 Murein DD-endopeptidase MepM and murein hydrolase activator NlpD, contain LysM domain [Thermocrinis minervae]
MSNRITLVVVFHEGREPKRISVKKSHIKILLLALAFLGTLSVALYAYGIFKSVENELLKDKVTSLERKLKQREYELSTLTQNKDQLIDKVRILESKIQNLEAYLQQRGILKKPSVGGPSRPVSLSNLQALDYLVERAGLIERHIKGTPLGYPTHGNITSLMGVRRNPFGKGYEFHSGIDIEAPYGAPVVATAEGIVRHAGWLGQYGKAVIIDHPTGYSTLYGHLSEVLVKVGQRVKGGEEIGRVGSTGRSTGPHLHYEVTRNGKYLDPLDFVSMR